MPTTPANLNPLEHLALSKVDLPKQVRQQIDPGDYEVDTVVRIRGSIGVGADYVQTVSAAVPWRDLFLAALAEIDPRRRRTFVGEYLRASEAGQPAEVNVEALAEEVHGLCAAILGTSERVCAGKTRAHLKVEALEAAVLEEVA
ncbi:MAG: hypothetical protein AAF628_32000 [Planctomycetota bacterium]